jgi:hypothetical protein
VLESFSYYIGFLIAVILCWKLGRLFWMPMLLDAAFDLSLSLVTFSGATLRWLALCYGMGIFVWVLALSQSFTRSMMLLLTCFEIVIVLGRMWEPLHMAGSGPDFWNAVSTSVYDVWLASILVVVLSVIVKSAVLAVREGKRIDLITNPKKRFLLPIGAWAAIILLPTFFPAGSLSDFWSVNRYKISAQVLVWGWVALEFPFFLFYRKLKKQYL